MHTAPGYFFQAKRGSFLKLPSKWEHFAKWFNLFFQHSNLPTYPRIGCRYYPLGLVIFVALERTFLCFSKYPGTFISNSVRFGCLRQDQCNIACLWSCSKQKCTGNWPLPPCKATTNCALWSLPCESADCRRYLLCFLILLFVFKDVVRYAGHRVWYSCASGCPRFPVLVDIQLVTINRHARCSL